MHANLTPFLTADRHIGQGFYRLSQREAVKLASPAGLPHAGYERLVKDAATGGTYWLCRTIDWGKTTWALRTAGNWKLCDDGKAKL